MHTGPGSTSVQARLTLAHRSRLYISSGQANSCTPVWAPHRSRLHISPGQANSCTPVQDPHRSRLHISAGHSSTPVQAPRRSRLHISPGQANFCTPVQAPHRSRLHISAGHSSTPVQAPRQSRLTVPHQSDLQGLTETAVTVMGVCTQGPDGERFPRLERAAVWLARARSARGTVCGITCFFHSTDRYKNCISASHIL